MYLLINQYVPQKGVVSMNISSIVDYWTLEWLTVALFLHRVGSDKSPIYQP